MAEELVSEPKIVVQGEDCNSLETNHDYLNRFKTLTTELPTGGLIKTFLYSFLNACTPHTCTTRTRLSGYFSNMERKASTGKQRTDENSAARADTVL